MPKLRPTNRSLQATSGEPSLVWLLQPGNMRLNGTSPRAEAVLLSPGEQCGVAPFGCGRDPTAPFAPRRSHLINGLRDAARLQSLRQNSQNAFILRPGKNPLLLDS